MKEVLAGQQGEFNHLQGWMIMKGFLIQQLMMILYN